MTVIFPSYIKIKPVCDICNRLGRCISEYNSSLNLLKSEFVPKRIDNRLCKLGIYVGFNDIYFLNVFHSIMANVHTFE